MKDVERALGEIADIRAQLAASTKFRGLAPHVSALVGLLALAVAVAQMLWPNELAGDGQRYVAIWVAFIAASIVIVAIEAVARSRRLHGAMAGPLLRATLRLLVPFGMAGSVITFVICNVAPDAITILPGLWLLLIALVGFSALPAMPRAILWPASWYFVSGSVVLWLAASSTTLSPWFMGVPFAIGQPAVALILYYANGARDG